MAGTTQEVFWLGERIQMARSWCVVAAHNKMKKKHPQMLLSSGVGSYCLRSSAPIDYYPTELVRRKPSDKSSFFSSSSKLRLRMMSSISRHHQPTSAAMLGAEKNLLPSKISGGVEEGHKEAAQRVALRVGLICGGPSAERGISLNSARSVLDHLKSEDVVVQCYYLNQDLQPFAISAAQMYSNTPADFDFKIGRLGLFHFHHRGDIKFSLVIIMYWTQGAKFHLQLVGSIIRDLNEMQLVCRVYSNLKFLPSILACTQHSKSLCIFS
jgi:hypothetical protein